MCIRDRREEVHRGRSPRRQGQRLPQGRRHRRHRGRPLQGHLGPEPEHPHQALLDRLHRLLRRHRERASLLIRQTKKAARTGGLLVCQKSLAEFRGRSREISVNHFRRRRVRRRKYFSRSGVSNCPPLADNRGAERSASPFVEEGFAFFDKLKAARTGGLFAVRFSRTRAPSRSGGPRRWRRLSCSHIPSCRL